MAAPTQVVRFKGRARLDLALVKHVRGEKRPDTALRIEVPAIQLGGNLATARLALKAAILARLSMPGVKPRHALDVMVAGPKRHASQGAWTEEEVRAWAKETYDWVVGVLGPNSVVAASSVHMDEASPHFHLLAVPINSEGLLGWKRVAVEAAAERGLKLDRKDTRYRALQDDYHRVVGARYGLARGKVGSKAQHRPVDRDLGLKATLERQELQAEQEAQDREWRLAEQKREADVREREAQVTIDVTQFKVAKLWDQGEQYKEQRRAEEQTLNRTREQVQALQAQRQDEEQELERRAERLADAERAIADAQARANDVEVGAEGRAALAEADAELRAEAANGRASAAEADATARAVAAKAEADDRVKAAAKEADRRASAAEADADARAEAANGRATAAEADAEARAKVAEEAADKRAAAAEADAAERVRQAGERSERAEVLAEAGAWRGPAKRGLKLVQKIEEARDEAEDRASDLQLELDKAEDLMRERNTALAAAQDREKRLLGIVKTQREVIEDFGAERQELSRERKRIADERQYVGELKKTAADLREEEVRRELDPKIEQAEKAAEDARKAAEEADKERRREVVSGSFQLGVGVAIGRADMAQEMLLALNKAKLYEKLPASFLAVVSDTLKHVLPERLTAWVRRLRKAKLAKMVTPETQDLAKKSSPVLEALHELDRRSGGVERD